MRLGDVVGDFARIERARCHREPGARPHDVAHGQSEDERKPRHQCEIAECTRRYPAERAQIAHSGNTGHDRHEDHRCNDHPHQFYEEIAERPQRFAGVRRIGPQQHPGDDGKQHLYRQSAKPPDQN